MSDKEKQKKDSPKKEKTKYSHMAEAQTSINYITCQTVLSGILVFFISFGYVYSLWSQQYLESVDESWATAPIVDVQMYSVLSPDA